MKTISTYKKAIIEKYEAGELEYLKELTPAKIRKDCLLKFDSGLGKEDLSVFSRFFCFEENLTNFEKYKKIQEIDINKFKPFKNFLLRITEDTLDKNAELIAVLVNFKPRPYINYRNQEANKKKILGNTVNSLNSRREVFCRRLTNVFFEKEILLNNTLPESVEVVSSAESNPWGFNIGINIKKTILASLFIFLSVFIVFLIQKRALLEQDEKDVTIINYIIWSPMTTHKAVPYYHEDYLKINVKEVPWANNNVFNEYKEMNCMASYSVFLDSKSLQQECANENKLDFSSFHEHFLLMENH